MTGHPAIAFVVAALLVPLVPRPVRPWLPLAAPVAGLGLLLGARDRAGETVGFFGFTLEPVRVDNLSEPFAIVFLVIAALAAGFGWHSMADRERVAALLYAAGGLTVVLAGDLLTLFIGWEVKAIASAVLIAFGPRRSAPAAALRYAVIHIIGGSALLGGMAWRLVDGSTLRFDDLGDHAGATLILIAFVLSAAVPPLHAWLPDAYPEASLAGTVFLSAYTTKAAVYALARGFEGTEVLIYLGVAMALYGVVYAILENEIRRLLGYHIVSQVGFMVAAVGIGGAAGINGATAHAFAHILYKGMLFMAAGALIHITGRRRLSDLGGLARSVPVLFVLYLVAALSISGFPLLSGFVSKELVVEAARLDERGLVVQFLKLASVGTFLSVGLKLPWFVFGGPARSPVQRPVPRAMMTALVVTGALNLAIGVRPALLYDLMPFEVDFAPYTAFKLVEITQLLAFTTLGFWLLAKKMGGEPSVTLDTDWLYRATPGRIAEGVGELSEVLAPKVEAGRQELRRVASGAIAAARSGALRTSMPPTTSLGAVLLGGFLLVLAWSVLP
jgi:multicomponent Na+:H+ antiporter subunit D